MANDDRGIPDSLFPLPIFRKDRTEEDFDAPEDWKDLEPDPEEREREGLAPPRFLYGGERTVRQNHLIQIPIGMRRYGIDIGTRLWLYWDGVYGRLVLSPQVGICEFCGTRSTRRFRNKFLCVPCAKDIMKEGSRWLKSSTP